MKDSFLICLRGRCFNHIGIDLTNETLLLSAKRKFTSFQATHVSIFSPAMSTGSMSKLHSICWVFCYPQNFQLGQGFGEAVKELCTCIDCYPLHWNRETTTIDPLHFWRPHQAIYPFYRELKPLSCYAIAKRWLLPQYCIMIFQSCLDYIILNFILLLTSQFSFGVLVFEGLKFRTSLLIVPRLELLVIPSNLYQEFPAYSQIVILIKEQAWN